MSGGANFLSSIQSLPVCRPPVPRHAGPSPALPPSGALFCSPRIPPSAKKDSRRRLFAVSRRPFPIGRAAGGSKKPHDAACDWLPYKGFSRIAEEVFGRGIEVLHRTGFVHHDHGACSNSALATASVGFNLAKSVIKHRRRKNYSLRELVLPSRQLALSPGFHS